jgi:molybdopterin molybdotransferase
MGDPTGPDWITVEEARARVLGAVRPLSSEAVPLASALGRVLARPLISSLDVPRWDNSAMDGFAVRAVDVRGAAADSPVRLRVIGDIAAGAFPTRELGPREAMRVMTGAAVPAGADGVVRVEHTDGGAGIRSGEGYVTVVDDQDAGRNIRKSGEDIRAGAEVIPAGRLLRPADIGVAASVGSAQLEVIRRPLVAILATGSELVDLDGFPEVLAGRRIVSSNSYTLAAQLRDAGMKVRDLGIAPDDPEDIRSRLERARGCDALITSAGVSVGEHDHIRTVLNDLGVSGRFWRVKMRPGSPIAFGMVERLGGIPWFGLPGNPVSSMVTFEVLVRPSLLCMGGHGSLYHPVRRARLHDSFVAAPGLTHFLRVTLQEDPGGALVARLTGPQGSGVLRSVADADGLLVLPGDGEDHRGAHHPAMLLGGAPLSGHPGY